MSNVALQARRFGPVNWIGCWSLLRRQFKNGFSDLHYTILGPVISKTYLAAGSASRFRIY